jgi:poly(A) polymerase
VHRIDPKLLDDNAVRVVRTLKDAGFEAYIVGGAVRDLLVGLRPKDFDVATDATPEQVKALFRRAFIIGRRFRSCTWCSVAGASTR